MAALMMSWQLSEEISTALPGGQGNIQIPLATNVNLVVRACIYLQRDGFRYSNGLSRVTEADVREQAISRHRPLELESHAVCAEWVDSDFRKQCRGPRSCGKHSSGSWKGVLFQGNLVHVSDRNHLPLR